MGIHKILTSDKQKEKVATTDGNKDLTFHITIVHELANVIENTLFDDNVLGATWYSFNTQDGPHNVTVGEIFASFFKNAIRAEQGLPLRTHYSLNDDGSVVTDSRLIKKSNVQNPFNTQYEPDEKVLIIWNNILSAKK